MLLGTLGASLLKKLWTCTATTRAGEGGIGTSQGHGTTRACQKF